jgi:AmmeMemoRadiSam system protein B
MSRISDIRPSPIAGQWYPGDPARLARSVDRYMDEATLPELPGRVIAVMAPHAGHQYSGPVAGYAFAALRGLSPDVVVVVSPMHYPYYEPLLTTAHQAYHTPLGDIPVHQAAMQELQTCLLQELGFGMTPVANDMEHSLEIELPFLQRALAKPFSLIPLMLRDHSSRVARGLGQCLARLISSGQALAGKSAILVASTDLSHFFTQAVADRLDAEVLKQVSAFDPEGVIRVEDEEKGFACGCGALAAVLWAAKDLGADRTLVLRHATSGDVTGDYERVVGYGAAVCLATGAHQKD